MLKIALCVLLLGIFYENAESACNVRCKLTVKAVADNCLRNKDQAYIPPDHKYNCCGMCAPVKKVIKRSYFKNCNSERCKVSKCKPDSANDCHDDNVLVPADGECFCCDTCLKRSKFDETL